MDIDTELFKVNYCNIQQYVQVIGCVIFCAFHDFWGGVGARKLVQASRGWFGHRWGATWRPVFDLLLGQPWY